MKRDFDLIRLLLLTFEKDCTPNNIVGTPELSLEGFSSEEISYNVGLLVHVGYLDAIETSVHGEAPSWLVRGITWEGHEFLDSARDPRNWAKAKSMLGDFGSATLETIKFVLNEIIKAAVQAQFKQLGQ